jgi:hypothetical protein
MAEQIAQALAEAHAQGLVHRQIALDRVVMSEDGAVEHLDFDPVPLGTEARTPADDIHSFGLLLEELFDGLRRPDRDLTTLIERMNAPVPAERPTAREVFDLLRWIREKPEGRLRTAVTLLRALIRQRR